MQGRWRNRPVDDETDLLFRVCDLELGRMRESAGTVGSVSQHVILHRSARWVCAQWKTASCAGGKQTGSCDDLQSSRFSHHRWLPLTVKVISAACCDPLCDGTEGPSCCTAYPQAALSVRDTKWQAWGFVRFFCSDRFSCFGLTHYVTVLWTSDDMNDVEPV